VSISKAQLEQKNKDALAKLGVNADDPDLKGGSLLDQLLLGAAQELTEQLRNKITEKKVVGTGNLRSSIDATETYKIGNGVAVNIRMADYYYWVDQGRGKTKKKNEGGMKVWEHIKEWIGHKGIAVPEDFKKDNLTADEELTSFAHAIANKIHSKGTIKRFGYKGANFIEEVLSPQNIDTIAQHLSDAFGQRILISVKMVESELSKQYTAAK
jgi:hypothetical protein